MAQQYSLEARVTLQTSLNTTGSLKTVHPADSLQVSGEAAEGPASALPSANILPPAPALPGSCLPS